jgi:nucleoside-diphosphate-sugar epimerase
MSSQYVCAERERPMTGRAGRAGLTAVTTFLVLGGTAWLGGRIAEAALAAGHDVTCLARGTSGAPPDGVRLVRADRDEPGAYAAVAGQDWDAVVDVSWQPGQVRSALQALGDRAAHWTYISSCSVYADHATTDLDETAPVLPELAGDRAEREQYGEAKVACERACATAVGDRLLVARPGLIGGYGDRSDRFGYWPGRFALAADVGGPVLVPDVGASATQTIAVGDLAAWLVRAGAARTVGVMNTVGERHAFGDVIRAAREAAGMSAAAGDERVVQVPSGWLREQQVEEYMGPRSLPLWLADPGWAGFSARDGSAARAAGLTHRSLRELAGDSLRWERELGLDRERRAGLSRPEELALLRRWAAAS